MSDLKKKVSVKKLSLSVKLAVILAAAAIVFLILAIAAAKVSVNRTVQAIKDIGDVTYDEAGKEKLDIAISYYNELDTDINLDKKVSNYDDLTAAKAEYVRLAIKTAVVADQRKIADGNTPEEIAALLAEARQAAEEYLTPEQYELVENYEELTALEQSDAYWPLLNGESGAGTPAGSDDAGEDDGEEPEIC